MTSLVIQIDDDTARSLQAEAQLRHATLEQLAESLLVASAQELQTRDLHPSSISDELGFVTKSSDSMDLVRRQAQVRREKITANRLSKREELAEQRPETPDALIGFLADAPEVAQAIRDMAYERRSQAYGV